MTFCACILSLSVYCLQGLPMLQRVLVLHFFLWSNNPVYSWTTFYLFISWCTFELFPMMNNAAVNTFSVFLGVYLGIELLSPVITVNVLRNCQTVPWWLCHFIFSPTVYEVFSYSISSPTHLLFSFLKKIIAIPGVWSSILWFLLAFL